MTGKKTSKKPEALEQQRWSEFYASKFYPLQLQVKDSRSKIYPAISFFPDLSCFQESEALSL